MHTKSGIIAFSRMFVSAILNYCSGLQPSQGQMWPELHELFLLFSSSSSDCCRSSPTHLISVVNSYTDSHFTIILHIFHHMQPGHETSSLFDHIWLQFSSIDQSDACKARVLKPGLAASWLEFLSVVAVLRVVGQVP